MPTSKTIVLNERPAKEIDPRRTFREETRTVGEPGKGEVLVKVSFRVHGVISLVEDSN